MAALNPGPGQEHRGASEKSTAPAQHSLATAGPPPVPPGERVGEREGERERGREGEGGRERGRESEGERARESERERGRAICMYAPVNCRSEERRVGKECRSLC